MSERAPCVAWPGMVSKSRQSARVHSRRELRREPGIPGLSAACWGSEIKPNPHKQEGGDEAGTHLHSDQPTVFVANDSSPAAAPATHHISSFSEKNNCIPDTAANAWARTRPPTAMENSLESLRLEPPTNDVEICCRFEDIATEGEASNTVLHRRHS